MSYLVYVSAFCQSLAFNFIYTVFFQTDFGFLALRLSSLFFFFETLSCLQAAVFQNYRKEFYPCFFIWYFYGFVSMSRNHQPIGIRLGLKGEVGHEAFARICTSGLGPQHVCAIFINFGVSVVLAEQN